MPRFLAGAVLYVYSINTFRQDMVVVVRDDRILISHEGGHKVVEVVFGGGGGEGGGEGGQETASHAPPLRSIHNAYVHLRVCGPKSWECRVLLRGRPMSKSEQS